MLIELEDLKNYIGLDTNDDDETLEILINGVGDFLKNYLGTVIEETEITEYQDGNDVRDRIYLRNMPINIVDGDFSLQYNAGTRSDPQWTDFNENDYDLDTETGIIEINRTYPGIRNILIEYITGYGAADIPNAIKIAALKLVAKLYNKRRSDGFSNESVAGAQIQWDTFLSSDIEMLIAPYRKVNI